MDLSKRAVFLAVLLGLVPRIAQASFITISAPLTGAQVADGVHVVFNGSNDIASVNVFLDGSFKKTTLGNFGNYLFDSTLVGDGNHIVLVRGIGAGGAVLGSDSVTVKVLNAVLIDPQVTSCTTAHMADNPTISDSQAANPVTPTQQSKVENNFYGTAAINSAANDYCANGNCATSFYASQLAGFHSAWGNDPVFLRVDGHCEALGPHPTTAEIMQWAAFKWGFSPTVPYAEGTNDSHWDMAACGDISSNGSSCCSIGIAQIAYCNNDLHPNHAMRGLNTGEPGHLLPKENTCFNLDLYGAFLYKRYHAAGCAQGSLTLTLAQWLNPGACAPNIFSSRMCNSIATHDWEAKDFNGQTVPY